MLVLMWIQTVLHSCNVPERIFFEKVIFEEKSADDNKSVKNYPSCKEFTDIMIFCPLLNFFEKFFEKYQQSFRQFGSRSAWVQTVFKGYQQQTQYVTGRWVNYQYFNKMSKFNLATSYV